jgi:RES domain-containing protein
MYLWRISNRCDLEGWGGERADGRWHTAERGKRIVYLAEHPAVALLEVLANLKGDPRLFPSKYQLIKIAVPDQVSRDRAMLAAEPSQSNLLQTQAAGNAWLASQSTALLAVPSLPSPESTNYLLNPQHPDAQKLTMEWCRWLQYDKRLFHVQNA